jgi:hypothetical protein
MFIAGGSLCSSTQNVDGRDKPGHRANMQIRSVCEGHYFIPVVLFAASTNLFV